eukprot:scaffold2900_cov330-Prasinococcus_capsulatus_cf.AAC.7
MRESAWPEKLPYTRLHERRLGTGERRWCCTRLRAGELELPAGVSAPPFGDSATVLSAQLGSEDCATRASCPQTA